MVSLQREKTIAVEVNGYPADAVVTVPSAVEWEAFLMGERQGNTQMVSMFVKEVICPGLPEIASGVTGEEFVKLPGVFIPTRELAKAVLAAAMPGAEEKKG